MHFIFYFYVFNRRPVYARVRTIRTRRRLRESFFSPFLLFFCFFVLGITPLLRVRVVHVQVHLSSFVQHFSCQNLYLFVLRKEENKKFWNVEKRSFKNLRTCAHANVNDKRHELWRRLSSFLVVSPLSSVLQIWLDYCGKERKLLISFLWASLYGCGWQIPERKKKKGRISCCTEQ